MSLLADTQTLLKRARPGVSLRSIALEPDVPYEWLKKFAAGVIDDPSVNRIQSLHDRLVALLRDRTRMA